jgi:hypothetical protein
MKYKIQRPPLAETFFLPSKERLLSLKPDDLVKIIFQIETEDEDAERMWVKIIKQQDSAEWTGILDNDPYGEKLKQVIKAGDQVIFHPLDIIQIWEDEKSS